MSATIKANIESDASGFSKGVDSANKSLDSLLNKAEDATKTLYDLRKEEQALKNETAAVNAKLAQMKLDSFGKTASTASNAIEKLTTNVLGVIPGFSSFASQTTLIGGALTELPAAMSGVSASASGMGAALSASLGPVTLIAGAIAAIVGIGAAAVKAGAEFDTHMSKLRAITGAAGEDLDILRNKSKELAAQSGKDAGDIADAFTSIGSQMPALLKTSEALTQVGEAAMTLGKAGSMSVEEASNAIATIVNQYLIGMNQMDPKKKGEEIAEATNDIINVLALAQQAGSANIQYLSDAMARAGVAATNSKIGYRELVATIETLAPVSTSAETAATGLNSVLTKLESQANNKLKPSIVGLQQALKNLSDMKLDTKGYKDMFGDVGSKTALQLVKMQDLLKEFNATLNDTAKLENAAADQAKTMSDNIKGDIDKLKGAWKGFLLELYDSESFSAIGAAIRPIIQHMTEWANMVKDVFKQLLDMEIVKDIFAGIGFTIKALSKLWQAEFMIIATAFKFVMSNIEIVIAGVKKLISWVIDLANKFGLLDNVKAIFSGMHKVVRELGEKIIGVFKKILDAYNELRKKVGLDPIEFSFSLKNSKSSSSGSYQADNGNEDTTTTTTTTNAVTSVPSKTQTKVEIIPDKGSIAYFEKKIQEIETKIKNAKAGLISEEDLKSLEEYTKKLDELKEKMSAAKIKQAAKAAGTPEQGQTYSTKQINSNISALKAALEIELDKNAYKEIQSLIKQWELLLPVDYEKGSLDELNAKISELQKKLALTGDKAKIVEYAKELIALKKTVEELNDLQIDVELAPGSIDYINKKLQDLQKEFNATGDAVKRLSIADEIGKWQNELNKINSKPIKELKNELKELNKDALKKTYDGVKGLVHGASSLYSTWNRVNEVLNDPEQEAAEKVFAVAEAITSTIDTFVGFVDTISGIVNAFTEISKAANMTKTAEQGVAIATGAATTAKQADVAATLQQTAANTTAIVTEEGKAMASAASSGAGLPFPANLVAIAAAVAAVLSVVATIASLAKPSYATGGVVNGIISGNGLTHGDRVDIRANQGEMILNSSQQAKLWNAIAYGNLGSSNPFMSGQVEFTIKGSKLIGVLNNYNKINSKR